MAATQTATSRARVKRPVAKQAELPGVEVDSRKDPKIEEAAEAQQAASRVLSQAHKDHEEAMENLVGVMKAYKKETKRETYSRAQWGSVTLIAGKISKAKAKFISAKPKQEDEEDYTNGEDRSEE